jgi:hypothetical protein
MSYIPVRRGFTGPKGKMGEGDPHHIDLKLLESLPSVDRVRAVDTLARQYQSIGREIEFSNAAVSGRRWNPSLDLSDKVQLLNQAAQAHSHSRHPGWQSLDFYVPLKGKSRFDKGAVEDASIFLPAIPGGTVRSKSGGGYGYYSEALDPSGRTVFRIGHGNIDRPEEKAELKIDPNFSNETAANASSPSTDPKEFLMGYLLGTGFAGEPKESGATKMKRQLVQQLLQPAQTINPMQLLASLPNPYAV